jgi:hypothetical protein
MVRSPPPIDDHGNVLPGGQVLPERLAHEVLAEAIRVNLAELIGKHFDPAAADLADTESTRRVALFTSVCNALTDATLVVPPTSTSYAVDESGVWAWRKGPHKPKDVAPSDPLDSLTKAQRKTRKKKGIVDADPTSDMVEEASASTGPRMRTTSSNPAQQRSTRSGRRCERLWQPKE